MEQYNLSKLIRIQIFGFEQSDSYYFEEGKQSKKVLGITLKKEVKRGFYTTFFGAKYVSETVPKNHVIQNGILYKKPMVALSFEEGHKGWKYFETEEDAINFARSVEVRSESVFIKM